VKAFAREMEDAVICAVRVAGLALVAAIAACSGPAARSSAQAEPKLLEPSSMTPAPDKARVYLILGDWRTGPLAMPLRVAQWQINDKSVGQASNGQALVADLPPGGYQFSWQAPWLSAPGKGITRDEVKLMLASGETRTLRAQLLQIAGLTSDDYRMSLDVSERDSATETPRDLRLLAVDTTNIVGTTFEPAPVVSEPPRTAQPVDPPATRCGRPTAERLRELNNLQREGLISAEEYARKRQAILDCL